ncbi:MAG: leucyl-tRNA synthetase [Parcubacteria group bacterium Athens0714_16]|nr:MAG: leucyl-tRNA synthetase [Parcubacteria group bacterium Athens0714_16]
MGKYNHSKIESKWQKIWEKDEINKTTEDKKKPKYYCLIEFPYASGEGLHVGHARGYTAMDVVARKKRAEGFNVLYPIGWDAFGLPTENYAIKTGVNPKIITKKNTDNFRKQLKSLGFSFDWSREINTSSPEYYKWTQWIFLQFFKHGLAYKKKMPINWCLSCKIGLANEEVVNGVCERCGGPVEKREKEQWMLAITKYAERLYDDLDKTEFLEKIKIQQRNWIGKSEGAEIAFEIKSKISNLKSENKNEVNVFTTRPDTLFGATYLVLAPEHEIISKLKSQISNFKEVEKYISETAKKKDIDRTAEGKQKTGIELKGIKAINPANKKEIPVFIADYVLAGYGTGAIMAVPAHDERDFAFASQMNADKKSQINADKIEIINVINPYPNSPVVGGIFPTGFHNFDTTTAIDEKTKKILAGNEIWTEFGVLRNSGKFDGMKSEEAIKEITKFVGGELKTTYKLRDWIFSRQRYWGEPIPLIFCELCKKSMENSKLQAPNSKEVPNSKSEIQNQKFNEGEILNPGWVVDEKLPLELPDVKKYEPNDNGESPLADIKEWVNVKCPKCGGPAKRETDTMPNWAGSSWYYLRYADNKNDKEFASMDKLKYWTPVDWYNGGMEHTTLHLLYSRFWHKFLFDIGLVPTDEPYVRRTSHGMILGEGGEKMSKSRGNVINPEDVVKKFGVDAFRLYEMFVGPYDQETSWSTNGVVGMVRFIERVCGLSEKIVDNENEGVNNYLNKTIKKVGEDIENIKFNTAVSSMMMFVNFVYDKNGISKENYKKFLKIFSPFAPHVTEELWAEMGEKESIQKSEWPKYDEIKENENFIVVVQVDGKIRDKFTVDNGLGEDEIKEKALSSEVVLKWVGDKKIKKTIYIKGKLVNIVTI